jgi:hypothetical protein
MKKVRVMLGVAGVAGVAPALGLMLPNATALAANHAQEGIAKASSGSGKMVRLTDSTSCSATKNRRVTSPHSSYTMWVYYDPSTGCVGGVSGLLEGETTGLSMRTRIYGISSGTKYQEYSNYVDGHFSNGHTDFYQGIHTILGGQSQQVCTAIVSVRPHRNHVQVGPLCVTYPG